MAINRVLRACTRWVGWSAVTGVQKRTGERTSQWRPITATEVPHLEAFGAKLRQARLAVGLTQKQLARACRPRLHPDTIRRLEAGVRRPRRSTLLRLAMVLAVAVQPDAPAHRVAALVNGLADKLAALAGPALAPESTFGAEQTAHSRKAGGRGPSGGAP